MPDIGGHMGTNVSLTPELENFVQRCVASGRYGTVSDVVRSALRLLEEAEARRTAFVASLDDAMAEGERDGFATADDVAADARAEIAATRARQALRNRCSRRARPAGRRGRSWSALIPAHMTRSGPCARSVQTLSPTGRSRRQT